MNEVTNADTQLMSVEVVYALREEQALLSAKVPIGSKASDVIEKSGVLDLYPELETQFEQGTLEIGLFGKLGKMNQSVRDKDRIEIYRPLIADPKEVRKKRAAEGKRMKKGEQKRNAWHGSNGSSNPCF